MVGLVDGNNFFVSCERVVDPKLRGRPVAVLSNNDGCCVSRSDEFKALRIPMGTPYFQLRDREATGELVFRSSNYELYGDLSRRVVSVLREEAVDVEQYSIDEAFIQPPSGVEDLSAYGRGLRRKIWRWVGIPCGVGFAPTKTLAKIANHIGKKRPDGVFIMPKDPEPILADLPVEEVWGIGRRLAAKFRARGIHTADQFRRMRDADIRALGSVVAVRTAIELRGTPCIGERDYDADPDSISCSRSFGSPVMTLQDLSESIASFTAQAARKLRRHGLLAAGANIFAQYGPSMKSMGETPKQPSSRLTSPSVYAVLRKRIMNTRPTASVLVTYGRKYTVWNSFRSARMELSAAEISSARRVERGTVMTTRMNVFRSACRK